MVISCTSWYGIAFNVTSRICTPYLLTIKFDTCRAIQGLLIIHLKKKKKILCLFIFVENALFLDFLFFMFTFLQLIIKPNLFSNWILHESGWEMVYVFIFRKEGSFIENINAIFENTMKLMWIQVITVSLNRIQMYSQYWYIRL